MAYEKGREALKAENELLAKLYECAADHVQSVAKGSGVASQIVNGWVGSFKELREFNEELINEDDEGFAQVVSSERDILKTFVETARKNGKPAQSWANAFDEDVRIAEQLLEK